ncbi:putative cysteine-type peptidase [Martensiomyces pterosporus]|nr:putative cysteine-type peptidase [Martensiomyces pterosporus]
MPTPPPPHLPATAAHVRRHHTPHNAADGDDGDGSVPVGEGHVVRRVVPSDNNCLFHALGSCLGDKAATPEWMRGVVCDAILRYPQTYTEAVLGMPVAEYCEWIGKSTSWGGGIELAIFSSELRLEICSIDIQTGRADRFGEGKHARRVILFYSGVHYDYAAFTYDRASPQDFDLTVFDTDESGDEKLAAACELADKMRQKHEFTDTANFALRCNDCSMLLRGEKEAQQHLLDTLHVNYSEV